MRKDSDSYHIPVMPDEAVDFLVTDRNGVYIDATLGGGGHSELILKAITNQGRVIAFDVDNDSINYVKERFSGKNDFLNRINFINTNFSNISKVLNEDSLKKNIKGILFDLGVSSFQIDTFEKGFMYKEDSVLDMRMDKTSGKPAFFYLNKLSETELAEIFRGYGEDKNPRALAKTIIKARKEKEFKTAFDLTKLLGSFIGQNRLNKVLSRVFQALRIYVNNELENLSSALEQSINILSESGRLVVISYHSLEDRIVKNFFREGAKKCICPPSFPVCVCDKKQRIRILTPHPVIPSEAEIENNIRSRSAKLRAAERI